MRLRYLAGAFAFFLQPGTAQSHEAFGDLGPFYQGLLHPLADPAQGLVLAGIAVLLARQPVQVVRPAFLVLLLCAGFGPLIHLAVSTPSLDSRSAGLVAVILGGVAIFGIALPAGLVAIMAGAIALLAGIAGDVLTDVRSLLLSTGGTAVGIAIFVLFLWAALDIIQSRLGRLAGAVAGSWVVAIGVMAAALPGAPA